MEVDNHTMEAEETEPNEPALLNQPLQSFAVECPDGEHPLHTPWSWWFNKKIKPSSQQSTISETQFQDNLDLVGTCHSLEQFASYYHHYKKPSNFPVDASLHLMRYKTQPMWEPFPLGGCWLIKVTPSAAADDGVTGSANWIWERLLFALIGETFADPDVIGVSLASRKQGIVISIWNLTESSRFSIGEKLEEIVQLPHHATIEYKTHGGSMKDRSSFRNAKPYLIVASTHPTALPAMELPPAEKPPATTESTIVTPAVPESTAPLPSASTWGSVAKAHKQEPKPVEQTPGAEAETAEAAGLEAQPASPQQQPTKLSFAEMARRQ